VTLFRKILKIWRYKLEIQCMVSLDSPMIIPCVFLFLRVPTHVTPCWCTDSRLQNKNKFHVNANGCMRMHCLCHQLPWPLIYTWILYYHIVFKLILEKLKFHKENENYQVNHCWFAKLHMGLVVLVKKNVSPH
jgi:hypothetical protein